MKQSEVFARGEGDAWYARNKDKQSEDDPVIALLNHFGIRPGYAYEVGCSDGLRLQKMRELFGCKLGGCDPSHEAINFAYINRGLENVYYGDARRLIGAEKCDVLIYGFCLYLCDPEDYFQIAAEGNRVLVDGGHLIIHDFDATDGISRRVPYKHKEGIFSHHVEFEWLWAGHPWYRTLETWYRREQSITILKKDSKGAWA